MPKKSSIEFYSSETDICAPITKFGGQPFWLETPQWPLSKTLGVPMQFLCQIALEEHIFPGCGGKVAYVFMMDIGEFDVDNTWDSNEGENAVIIQPNGNPTVLVGNISIGSTLQNYVADSNGNRQPQDVVVGVQLILDEDPDFIPEDQLSELYDKNEAQWQDYYDKLSGNKIGGSPLFIQNDEFPDKHHSWKLLLQLDGYSEFFDINFGSGIAYAFINEDASIGKFLWQC